jgi:DNA-directed RNA polymerase subunit beta
MKELKAKHKELLDKLTERLADYLLGEKLPIDICEAQTGAFLVPANRKITKSLLRTVAAQWRYVDIDPSPIRNRILQIIAPFENDLEAVEAALANKK